ncbi:MraY family glycosyltransferase [Candidatus Hydrogenedentota bacterium]
MRFIAYLYLFAIATLLSLIVTRFLLWFSHRFEVYDHPTEDKLHTSPTPLLGGVSIFITMVVVIVSHVILVQFVKSELFEELFSDEGFRYVVGSKWTKIFGLCTGWVMIFFLGLWDDLKAMTPYQKLAGQILAALVLVLCGIRLDIFVPVPFVGSLITIGWIVLMSNSFNLLDNMDGLSGGVAVISSLIFCVAVFRMGQYFAAGVLLVFAGSVMGFLYYNFNPARIFMGDSGAMLCGYTLASVCVLCTFYTGQNPTRGAVFMPLLILAVPLFDTVSVIVLRIKDKQSIIMGDKQRHFSHRLVRLGMSTRSAVLFIYIVTFVTGTGALLLGNAQLPEALIVLIQALGIFLIIVLLMMIGIRNAPEE